MKYVIVFGLLFLSLNSRAQSKKDTADKWKFAISSTGEYKPAAMIKNHSDTLEVYEPLQFHFIKIGNDVYELIPHNTTIEKVPPLPLFRGLWQGTLTPNVFTNPNSMEVPIKQ